MACVEHQHEATKDQLNPEEEANNAVGTKPTTQ